MKPPITEYNIYHNITSSNGSKDTVTNNNILFNDSVCGEYYTISVSAKNVIGNGNNESINSKLIKYIILLSSINNYFIFMISPYSGNVS